MNTRILTQSDQLARVQAVNSTTAGTTISNPTWTTTRPTTGMIPMGAGGSITSNGLLLLPYGVGSATNTFLMSVFGWDFVHPTDAGSVALWVAWPLATFTCTLVAAPAGVAGTDVNASQLAVNTIVGVIGNQNISYEAVSPTGSYQASVVLDAKGAKYVQVLFATNNSATSANALYRRM